MEGKTKKPMHRGHNEGNIRQRTDGRWEVRLSAGIDYKPANQSGLLPAATRNKRLLRSFRSRRMISV